MLAHQQAPPSPPMQRGRVLILSRAREMLCRLAAGARLFFFSPFLALSVLSYLPSLKAAARPVVLFQAAPSMISPLFPVPCLPAPRMWVGMSEACVRWTGSQRVRE